MSIEANKGKVGYGSWWSHQSYGDYKETMELHEYLSHIYQECVKRVENIGLQEGDLITVLKIDGKKPMKYKGKFAHLHSGLLVLQQKNREVSFDIRGIDDIEILELSNVKKKDNVIYLSKYLH